MGLQIGNQQQIGKAPGGDRAAVPQPVVFRRVERRHGRSLRPAACPARSPCGRCGRCARRAGCRPDAYRRCRTASGVWTALLPTLRQEYPLRLCAALPSRTNTASPARAFSAASANRVASWSVEIPAAAYACKAFPVRPGAWPSILRLWNSLIFSSHRSCRGPNAREIHNLRKAQHVRMA